MKNAAVIALAALAFIAGLIVASALTTCPAPTERRVVLPTCAELDKLGYDGLASCVDAGGAVRRPGEP